MKSSNFPNIRILMVEDEEDDALLVLRHISREIASVHFRRVDTEVDMIEALRDKWDIVLCDHMLPRFSVGRALFLLRQLCQFPVPFILISGKISPQQATPWLLHGVQDYLEKGNMSRLMPVLVRVLRECLSKVEWHRTNEHLKKSLYFLSALTNNLPGAVFQGIWKNNGIEVIYLSQPQNEQVFGTLTGLKRDGHQPLLLEHVMMEEDVPQLHRTLRRSVKNNFAHINWEGRLKQSGRRGLWVNMRASLLYSKDHESVQLDGLLTDVTQLHRAMKGLKTSRSKLAKSNVHFHAAIENERSRIAADLHDDLGNHLVMMKFETSTLAANPHVDRDLAEKILNIDEMGRVALEKVRGVVRELRPSLLEEFGLASALEALAQDFSHRMGIRTRFTIPENLNQMLNSRDELILYRILQEGLTNVIKHAQAHQLSIQLIPEKKSLHLLIYDDGIGFKAQDLTKPDSFGIKGARARMRQIGGDLSITAHPSGGTTLRARFRRTANNSKKK